MTTPQTSLKALILDFDGVIADSRAAAHGVMDQVARHKGVEPLNEHEVARLTMRQLFKRMRIRWFEIPYYVRLGRREMARQSDIIALHLEVLPTLVWAQAEQIPLMIVSSNGTPLIEAVLSRHLPRIKFDRIVGDAPLFGKHRAIKRLMKKRALTSDQVVYLGDEVRDIQAARRAGVACAAVGWGKDSEALLQASHPAFYAASGETLLTWLRQRDAAVTEGRH